MLDSVQSGNIRRILHAPGCCTDQATVTRRCDWPGGLLNFGSRNLDFPWRFNPHLHPSCSHTDNADSDVQAGKDDLLVQFS
jgi:hypothetical protein